MSVYYLPLVFYFNFLLVITNRGQKRHIKENLYPPFEAIFNVEWSSVHTCWTVVIFSSDIYLLWMRSILCKLHGWAFCSNRYGWDLGNPLIIGSESLNRLTSVRVFLFKNWLVAGGFRLISDLQNWTKTDYTDNHRVRFSSIHWSRLVQNFLNQITKCPILYYYYYYYYIFS